MRGSDGPRLSGDQVIETGDVPSPRPGRFPKGRAARAALEVPLSRLNGRDGRLPLRVRQPLRVGGRCTCACKALCCNTLGRTAPLRFRCGRAQSPRRRDDKEEAIVEIGSHAKIPARWRASPAPDQALSHAIQTKLGRITRDALTADCYREEGARARKAHHHG